MTKNIFPQQNIQLKKEDFQDLLLTPNFRLERIISKGHATPKGEWYDQNQNEWVILLKGKAALRFDNKEPLTVLCPGDYLLIPVHKRHRVEWTSADEETIWMALFY